MACGYSSMEFWKVFHICLKSVLLDSRSAAYSLICLFNAGIVSFIILVNYCPSNKPFPGSDVPGLQGARVLITGASTGEGERMAYLFASQGAILFLTSRSEKRVRRVVSQCERLGAGEVYYHVANMMNSSSIDEMTRVGFYDQLMDHKFRLPFRSFFCSRFQHTYLIYVFRICTLQIAIRKLSGRIDYLMANHHLPKSPSLWMGNDHDFSEMRLLLEVNFFSYVRVITNLLPCVKAARGRILNVSNVQGMHPFD